MCMREHRLDITRRMREFFENGMRGHTAVSNITQLKGDVYKIERTGDRPDLTVLIVDIYIFGEADVLELSEMYSGIDSIVLVGFYNRYSRYAKRLACEMNVGLFENREFFGALNLVGHRFLGYQK